MKTLMVVDDSFLIRSQLARMLKEADYAVVEACDGLDALEKLRAQPVDLVLADVNMPRMSGIEMLEQISIDAAFAGVSVLMITTEGQTDIVRKAKGLGAKGWLIKPVKPETLLASVKSLLAGESK